MAVVDKFLGDMVCADVDAVATEICRDDFVKALKGLIVIVLEVNDVEMRHSNLIPCQLRGIKKAVMVE